MALKFVSLFLVTDLKIIFAIFLNKDKNKLT